MTKDKVTIEDLKKFVVGEQKVFTLPNIYRVKSAQSLASQIKDYPDTLGWKFTTTKGDQVEGTLARSITITRIA